MNQAAARLLSVDDFGAFCKAHADVKTTLCNVTEAVWVRDAEDSWHFRISANRFLRNMVRAVVGTLIEVGRHRMTLEQFDVMYKPELWNIGQTHAKCDKYCFLDSDVYFSNEDWLDQIRIGFDKYDVFSP